MSADARIPDVEDLADGIVSLLCGDDFSEAERADIVADLKQLQIKTLRAAALDAEAEHVGDVSRGEVASRLRELAAEIEAGLP